MAYPPNRAYVVNDVPGANAYHEGTNEVLPEPCMDRPADCGGGIIDRIGLPDGRGERGMSNKSECTRCAGCGKVADSEEGEAWKYWEELPFGANIAVVLGIVKPIACPKCGGSGLEADNDTTD